MSARIHFKLATARAAAAAENKCAGEKQRPANAHTLHLLKIIATK